MKRLFTVLAVLSLLICVSACDPAPTTTAPANPATPTNTSTQILSWDMSQDQSIAVVGWPKEVTDDVWEINDIASIRLKLPGGRTAQYLAAHLQVWRFRNRVTGVRVLFPDENVENAYQRATALANEWGITDHGLLDEWRKHGGSKRGGFRTASDEIRHITESERVVVQVWTSALSDDKPYYVSLDYVFAKNEPDMKELSKEAEKRYHETGKIEGKPSPD